MVNDHQRLGQLLELSIEINQIQDIDALLEKILSSARKLVNADAGTIYIKDDDRLQFSHAQNETFQKRLPPGQKLIYRTFSVPISHNSISGYVASTGETLNIPDVYQLNPDQVPYAFDPSYDEKTQYRTQSMLTLPLKNNQLKIIGVMQLINAQNEQGEVVPFLERDIPLIKMFANYAVMVIERAQKTRDEIMKLIRVLSEVCKLEETEAHVNRVGLYSAKIYEVWARKKGIPETEIERNAEILRVAAMLHDLGKLSIPQAIRDKPDRLTAEEFEVMKQHTVKGAQMLLESAHSEYEKAAAQIALNHHEHWDGSGYPGHIDLETGEVIPGYKDKEGKPRGKRGEEIPIFGRVVAIADVFDALSCPRAFRKAMEEADILKIIKKGIGTHFDPEIVSVFFSSLDTIQDIAQRFPDKLKV